MQCYRDSIHYLNRAATAPSSEPPGTSTSLPSSREVISAAAASVPDTAPSAPPLPSSGFKLPSWLSSSLSSSPSTAGHAVENPSGSLPGTGAGSGSTSTASHGGALVLRKPTGGGPFIITPLTLHQLHESVSGASRVYKVGGCSRNAFDSI